MGDKKVPADKLDTGERKKPETLTEVAADAKTGGTGTGKKRGPYKKKKKDPEPEPEPIENPFDQKAIEAVYQMFFNKAASRPGHGHWALQPHESAMMGQTTMAMIDKYLPTLGPWMIEINFGIAIGIVFVPRFLTSMEIKKAEKAAEEKAKQAESKEKIGAISQ